jgi:hypothetical protein
VGPLEPALLLDQLVDLDLHHVNVAQFDLIGRAAIRSWVVHRGRRSHQLKEHFVDVAPEPLLARLNDRIRGWPVA